MADCKHEFGERTSGKAYWMTPIGAELTGSFQTCKACGGQYFEVDAGSPRPAGVPSEGLLEVGKLVYRGPSSRV